MLTPDLVSEALWTFFEAALSHPLRGCFADTDLLFSRGLALVLVCL